VSRGGLRPRHLRPRHLRPVKSERRPCSPEAVEAGQVGRRPSDALGGVCAQGSSCLVCSPAWVPAGRSRATSDSGESTARPEPIGLWTHPGRFLVDRPGSPLVPRTTRGSRRVLVGAGLRSDRAAAGRRADDHRARIRIHPEPRRRPRRQRGVRDPATDDAPRVVAEPIPSRRRVRGDRRDATTARAAPRDVSPTERRAARPVGGRRLSAFSPGSLRGPSPDLPRGELPSEVWRRRPSSARPLGSPSRPARCPRPLPHRSGRKRGVARPRGRAVADCGPCS